MTRPAGARHWGWPCPAAGVALVDPRRLLPPLGAGAGGIVCRVVDEDAERLHQQHEQRLAAVVDIKVRAPRLGERGRDVGVCDKVGDDGAFAGVCVAKHGVEHAPQPPRLFGGARVRPARRRRASATPARGVPRHGANGGVQRPALPRPPPLRRNRRRPPVDAERHGSTKAATSSRLDCVEPMQSAAPAPVAPTCRPAPGWHLPLKSPPEQQTKAGHLLSAADGVQP